MALPLLLYARTLCTTTPTGMSMDLRGFELDLREYCPSLVATAKAPGLLNYSKSTCRLTDGLALDQYDVSEEFLRQLASIKRSQSADTSIVL